MTQLGVRNLGGNLTEWLQDNYMPYTSPCWNQGALLVDPLCTDASNGIYSLRGGSWNGYGAQAAVSLRNGGYVAQPVNTIGLGFRCALPR